MAALDFPASPTNGQLYPAAPNAQYIYNATAGGPSVGAWESLPMESAKTVTADVPPANPVDGDQWFSTVDGVLYIYVVDIDGGQWVESRSAIISDGYYSPNYVINGGFDIWQRGTTGFTSGYSADRWFIGGVQTVSRSTDVPNTSFKYSLQSVTASPQYNIITHRIEAANLTGFGTTVTLSFWAKSIAGTNGMSVDFYRANSVDAFGTSTYIGGFTAAASLSSSWTKYTGTITINDATLQNGLEIRIYRINDQTNGFLLSGVQLESGSVATPFRRNANSIQGELAACQRYYYRIGGKGLYEAMAQGAFYATTGVATHTQAPVTMRTTPTSTEFSNILVRDYGSDYAVTGGGNNGGSADFLDTYFTIASGGTAFRPCFIRANNSLSSYLAWSAEL